MQAISSRLLAWDDNSPHERGRTLLRRAEAHLAMGAHADAEADLAAARALADRMTRRFNAALVALEKRLRDETRDTGDAEQA